MTRRFRERLSRRACREKMIFIFLFFRPNTRTSIHVNLDYTRISYAQYIEGIID